MKKPKVRLVGRDGNVFNLMGITAKALKKAGLEKEKKEMMDKVIRASSYDQALQIIMEYVEVE